MNSKLDGLRKLGYAEDSPEIQSVMKESGESAAAAPRSFDENYRNMVREMKESGLVPSNVAELETTSQRVKEALA